MLFKKSIKKCAEPAGLFKVDPRLGANKQWSEADELEYQHDEIVECEIDDLIFNN